MSEREIVAKVINKEIDGGKKHLFIMHSIDRDDCPRSADRIRIDMFKGFLFEEIEGGVLSIQLQQTNMKGHFPMRLMNMAISNAMRKQFKEVMIPKLKQLEQSTAKA